MSFRYFLYVNHRLISDTDSAYEALVFVGAFLHSDPSEASFREDFDFFVGELLDHHHISVDDSSGRTLDVFAVRMEVFNG